MDELRSVSKFAALCASEILHHFEEVRPNDDRPRSAIIAAWAFSDGGARINLLRTSAFAANRAAIGTPSEVARLAARSAGDAAAAAYLHPIAKSHQVAHILRAGASWMRVAELTTGSTAEVVGQIQQWAEPTVLSVLRRYPPAPAPKNRVLELMAELDRTLREPAA